MKMKRIAVLSIPALILATTFTTLQAQANDSKQGHRYEQGHKGGNSEKMLKRMAKKLNLTEQQQTDLKALYDSKKETREQKRESRKSLHDSIRNLDPKAADYATRLNEVKQQAGLAAQTKIDDMMQMRTQMQAILTPEQYAQMKEMKEKRGKRGKRGKHSDHDS